LRVSAKSALPPKDLRRRVGWATYDSLSGGAVEEPGLLQWRYVKSLLPHDWNSVGKQILDYGCGVGRVLRPALGEDPQAEFWACDVHASSIQWLASQVPSSVRVLPIPEWPPTDLPSDHFDLVYAFSVFTHLTDSWSAWLLELHRLLKDDGLLLLTVFGPGHTSFGEEPISEDIIGMNILNPSASWDIGGPLIAHSEWWLRAHWGRAFDIVDLRAGETSGAPPLFGQSGVVMRKRPGQYTIEDVERAEPGEARELAAAQQNVMSLRREIARDSIYLTSRSWRLTAPLRAVGRSARKYLDRS
jgi:SAM-dependent methyltransferase